MAQSIAEQEKLESAGFAKRLTALQQTIAAPAFSALPGETQYRDLLTAGKLAIALGQQRRGYDFIDRAADRFEATLDVRLLQVQVALKLGFNAQAIAGMTSLVQRWPEQVANLPAGFLEAVLNDSDHVPHGTYLALLQALYAMHWRLKWDIEPSPAWRDLSLLLLEQGLLAEAVDVAAHVDDPYVLIGMRADRRFDAVVAKLPRQFDIDAQAALQLKNLESASDQEPKALALKTQVIAALGHQEHYAAMLAESDSVVSAIKSTNFPEKLFVDYYGQYGELLDLRAVALQREGQADDAAAQFKTAAAGNNVNQLINLAEFYCDAGRPADALAPIRRVQGTSRYGTMVLESVRLEAAVQMGDRAQTSASLRYLRMHAADAPGAYLDGLLSANQLDRAAKVLVQYLLDLDQRQEALTRVQDYALPPQTAREREITSRWREVVARTRVQTAIHKVGRVESYRLEAP